MKKGLLFVAFLITSVVGFAQVRQDIQDTFYGCNYGSPLNEMKNVFSQKFDSYKVDNNALRAYNVKFGGLDWNFLKCNYYNNQFYGIDFSNNYSNKNDAIAMYRQVKSILEDKYAKPSTISVDNTLESSFWYDSSNSLSLSVRYADSIGEGNYYYLTLSYWNNALLGKLSDSMDNEGHSFVRESNSRSYNDEF